ncbi:hypothetical protein [Salibacterium qingdaonense]|uniref:Uncharacterized protein n=1 Tax=Salibacterium qingdaonense TaxID=266892 RepID=A0A1I4P065_9BACI|nr:hypothetical protein [Salibacterium qingdaonense]SFM21191.1 hypothetical protein SAMN04488054_12216 [Salibacterium qingdaonense]
MKYLIDHKQKLIHKTAYAGDACRFNETPLEEREVSHSKDDIDTLIKTKGYMVCENCYHSNSFIVK